MTSCDRGGTPGSEILSDFSRSQGHFNGSRARARVSGLPGQRRCTLHRCANTWDVTERHGHRESLEQNRPILVTFMFGTDLPLGTTVPSDICVLPDKLAPGRSVPPPLVRRGTARQWGRRGRPQSIPETCTRPAQQLTFSPFSFSSVSLSDSLFSSVTRPKKKKKKKGSCKCEFF